MQLSVTLGPRLLLVASYVPQGACLGDIGTDHAYLPIYLWEQGRIPRAVAVDVHAGPYRSACAAIQSRQLTDVIDVRHGDGIKPILPGEVDCLTLAGMGGNTMLEIFSAQPLVMDQVHTLVLQPQGAEAKVRQSLLASGWRLEAEQLVEEEGRIYGVMGYSRHGGQTYEEVAAKVQAQAQAILDRLPELRLSGESITESTTPEPTDHISERELARELAEKLLWDIGPFLVDNPVPELGTVIAERIAILDRSLREMAKSQQPEVQEKIQRRRGERIVWKGMLTWLFPSA